MSAQELSAALDATDSPELQYRLYQLASTKPKGGASLVPAAEAYLRAFCDSSHSLIWRRWVGLSLRRMLESSIAVATHLQDSENLPRLGQVILNNAEAEETKVVAGIIVRQGLERGIPFGRFWPSDKVQNNAPFFPTDAGPQWMHQFQGFLDALNDLILANPITDPVILFPVAVIATDGHKWRDPDDAIALVFIQGELLTIIAPDSSLQDIAFVDVPLSHICSVRSRRSVLHDSQGQTINVEPWDLVLKLKSGPWTYRVNSSSHEGNEVTIMFRNRGDANECENSLLELLPPSGRLASTDPINFSLSPHRQQNGGQSASQNSRAQLALPCIGEGKEQIKGDQDGPKSPQTGVALATAFIDLRPTPKSEKTSALSTALRGASSPWAEPKSHTKPTQSDTGSVKVPETAPSDESRGSSQGTAAQSQPLSVKAGSLSVVRKKPVRSATVHDDVFEFPDQVPRIDRLSVPNREIPIKVKTNGKAITKPKPVGPKPKAKRLQMNNTEDEEDHLISQVVQSSTPTKSAPQSQNLDSSPEKEPESIVVPPKSSSLPKVSKPSATHVAKPVRDVSDVFDIPQEDEVLPKIRGRRKSTRSVVYKEGETSREESSGSEFTATKTKRRRSPAKQSRPTKAINLKKTPEASTSIVKAKSKKSRALKAALKGSTAPKTALLANLISKPQSRPNVALPDARSDEENAPLVPDDGKDSQPQVLEDSPNKGEISILDRLNSDENEDEHSAILVPNSQDKGSTIPQKRPVESSTLSTPRAKRPRRDLSSAGAAAGGQAEQGMTASSRPPTTMAPPRLLDDPSSPCNQQNRSSQYLTARNLGDLGQKPAKVVEGQTPQIAAPVRRLKSLGNYEKPQERGQTPVHRHMQRTFSGGSVNAELLSSNSKPLPASPRADSTAISGHADRSLVNMEQEIGEYQTAKSDPFDLGTNSHKVTPFTRRLTGEVAAPKKPDHLAGLSQDKPIEVGSKGSSDYSSERDPPVSVPKRPPPAAIPPQLKASSKAQVKGEKPIEQQQTQSRELPKSATLATAQRIEETVMEDSEENGPQQLVENTQPEEDYVDAGNLNMEGDTLIPLDDEPSLPLKASPVHFHSSPPPFGSPSSHSSTSAEAEPETDPPIPTSEAEELEWEASLQPHQRAVQDQLIRVSKRVLRHVVDNETAVTDITDTYETDGEHLINSVNEKHNGEVQSMFKGMEKKRSKAKKTSEQLAKKLARERQDVFDEMALE